MELLQRGVPLQEWSLHWRSQQWAQEPWLGLWNLPWCRWARLTDTRATFDSWHQSNYQKGLAWTFPFQQLTPQVSTLFFHRSLTFWHSWCFNSIMRNFFWNINRKYIYTKLNWNTPFSTPYPSSLLGNQSQSSSTVDGNLQRRDSARRRASAHIPAKTNHLVISGGDGYEDFRLSNSSETVGRDDSTNHLLLWRVWDNRANQFPASR